MITKTLQLYPELTAEEKVSMVITYYSKLDSEFLYGLAITIISMKLISEIIKNNFMNLKGGY